MIKKIQKELIFIVILVLGIFVMSFFDFNFFKTIDVFDLSFKNKYFKNFFINITEIGNSLWFFLISFFSYLLFYLIDKKKQKKILIKKLKKFSLIFFISLVVTGFLTQIAKHIIGRPRPNYSSEADLLGVNFFSLDSAFHSFPSGHTSTIFVVALVLSILTPKIKYFYFFFALIISVSRVVVGAHYFSDIVGGIIFAIIGLKLTLWVFNKYENNNNTSEKIMLDVGLFFLSIIIFFITIVFLTVGSQIDIFVTSFFYQKNQVFLLQSFSPITVLAREIFLPFVVLYILIIPVISIYLPINRIYFGLRFNLRSVIFLWCSLLFNVVIVVNLALKGFWGRARPNEVLNFGGKEDFSPWFKLSESCASNCSFVSGDAAVGFSLISLYFISNNKKFYWAALLSGFFLGIIRIAEGGHFLSDIVIAGFLILTLTYLQFLFYRK